MRTLGELFVSRSVSTSDQGNGRPGEIGAGTIGGDARARLRVLIGWRTPARFLRGNAPSLVMTVVALASGVALVCAVDLVNSAVLSALVEVIDTMSGRAALQIAAGEGGAFPETVVESVGAVSGVEIAVPVISGTAFVADESGEALTVQAVDIGSDEAVRVYEAHDEGGVGIAEDPLTFLAQPDSVVLTQAFTQRRGLRVDDHILLDTPVGRRDFVIRGILEPKGVARALGGNLLIMDVYAAQLVFTRPGFVNRVDVVVQHGSDVAAVGSAISRILPPGLRVDTAQQRALDLQKLMRAFEVVLQGVGLVGLLAAFLIAFNRLATVFESRTWQLGVMNAVGVRLRNVRRELVKEGLFLGAVGVLVGVPLGIALAHVLRPVIAAGMVVPMRRVIPDGAIGIQVGSLVRSAVLGLGTAWLAAALPAWRASRLTVAEVARSRGVEQPEGYVRWRWLPWAIIGTATVTAIVMQRRTRVPEWGLAATALIAVGAAFSARPLILLTRLPLHARWSGLLRPTARLVTSNVFQNRRRNGLIVATIGIGLGCFVWISTAANSFERSMNDQLSIVVNADFIVRSAHASAGFFEAPVDESLIADVSQVPGVAAVGGSRVIDWSHRGEQIAINAMDASYFRTREFGEWPLVGSHIPALWETVARGDAVVVSSNFAVTFGSQVGDVLEMIAPTGPVELLVGGVTAAGFESPRGVVVMSRERLKRHWRDGQINRAFVRVVPGADLAEVRAAVARQCGRKYQLRILSAADFVAYYVGQVRRIFAALDVIAVVLLVVVLVGLADTLAAGVAERTRQLGAMRAIGVRRRWLGRMVLAEGTLLGALGLVLAAVAGLSLGIYWVKAIFPSLIGFVLDLYIPYTRVVGTALLALGVCVIAGLLPARRATRLQPAVMLRYD